MTLPLARARRIGASLAALEAPLTRRERVLRGRIARIGWALMAITVIAMSTFLCSARWRAAQAAVEPTPQGTSLLRFTDADGATYTVERPAIDAERVTIAFRDDDPAATAHETKNPPDDARMMLLVPLPIASIVLLVMSRRRRWLQFA